MIDKNKIIKVEVYTPSDRLIVSTDDFSVNYDNPMGLGVTLFLKGSVLAAAHSNLKVKTITYMVNGDRIGYVSRVSVATEYQINVVLIENMGVLEERRRYFKIKKDIPAQILLVTNDDQTVLCSDPFEMMIKDINIGGVFILTGNHKLHVDEVVTLKFTVMGQELVQIARILRCQKKDDKMGYGCCFIRMSSKSEETIAKYINMIQRESLDQIKTKISKR